MSEIEIVMAEEVPENHGTDEAKIPPNFVSRATGLRVEVTAQGSNKEGWWVELAVHADLEDEGTLEVAVYLDARRLVVGLLDEWGDWAPRIENLPYPEEGRTLRFEVQARPVRLRAETAPLQAPMNRLGLLNEVERQRGWPRGASLQGAHLEGAILSQAKFDGVDLRDVNLVNAKLWGAQLRGALLHRAQLRDANLLDADLSDADLEGANLAGARLDRARLDRADLSNADLRGVSFEGATLSNARLEGAELEGVDFRRAHIENVDLTTF